MRFVVLLIMSILRNLIMRAPDVCGSHEFSRRADDTADRVAERLRVYHEQTKPLLPFYQKKGLLREIDVTRSVTEVSSEILAAVIS